MSCALHKDHPENAKMAPGMLLEHFLNCMDREQQKTTLALLRDQAECGFRCLESDHEASLQAMREHRVSLSTQISTLKQIQRTDQAYIRSLLQQLRELLAYCRTERADHARFSDSVAVACFDDMSERLEAILTTQVQSVEQVES